MAQAESTWVPGSVPRWFTRPKTVTHRGTNRAWRRVTMSVESFALPLRYPSTCWGFYNIVGTAAKELSFSKSIESYGPKSWCESVRQPEIWHIITINPVTDHTSSNFRYRSGHLPSKWKRNVLLLICNSIGTAWICSTCKSLILYVIMATSLGRQILCPTDIHNFILSLNPYDHIKTAEQWTVTQKYGDWYARRW